MKQERTLKLLLEYDGTDFAGWQIQPDVRTVQKTVEDSIEMILHHPVCVTASGRTDAGVHAAGQVANFRTVSKIEVGRLKRALNGVLPGDVTVLDISETNRDFNARFDAVSRTYRYTLSDRKLSIARNGVWHIKYKLSRELLEASTRPLYGMCNLRGFSKSNNWDDYSTIIFKNFWEFRENLMIFEISAKRFFHHSVRSIVGSAVEVARGKESIDLLQRILDTRDRSLAGPTAPALGLCLVRIDYGEER